MVPHKRGRLFAAFAKIVSKLVSIHLVAISCSAYGAISEIEMPRCSSKDITSSQEPSNRAIKQRIAFESMLGTARSWAEYTFLNPPPGLYTDLVPVRRALDKNAALGRLIPTQPKWDIVFFTCQIVPSDGGAVFCTGSAGGTTAYLIAVVAKQRAGVWSCNALLATSKSARDALGGSDHHEQEALALLTTSSNGGVMPKTKISDLPAANPYRIWAEKNQCLWNHKFAYTSSACGSKETALAVGLKKGSDPIGGWIGKNFTIQVTRAGDLFKVVTQNPTGILNGTYVGKYQDGKIDLSIPACGPLTYSKDNDQIYLCGVELSRN